MKMATNRYINCVFQYSVSKPGIFRKVRQTNVELKRFYTVQRCPSNARLNGLFRKHRLVINSGLITRAKSSTSTGVDEILSKAASEITKDDSFILNQAVSDLSSNAGLVKPELTDVTASLNALGEESIKSLGLGKFTPSGLMQQLLETVHVSLDIPWWGTIVLVTVMIRGAMFPLYLMSRRMNIKTMNHSPETQAINDKLTRARMRRDNLAMEEYKMELKEYQKKHGIQTYKLLVPMVAQIPIFISMFFGIREMATFPLESMKTGGILWFTDLTVTDPYLGLPLLTSATIVAIVKVGAENPNAGPMMKKVGYVGAGVVAFFMMNFPSALCCYWVSTNLVSLLQAFLFSFKGVQKFLQIPETIVPANKLLKKDKSLKETFREMKEMAANTKKMSNEEALRDFERIHAIEMERSGKGPVPVTYKHNPKSKRSTKSGELKA
ncbi:mitochondrial inner membrane protein OXA1L-like [Ostrea edulis]|uniref:mitochondrial inner membrane protein OXA1L-like n=1 Tax=Ostrea edulis TaxID=37623 RepID=UPI002095F8BC|nr:mitochondrial inner membrane protein OXA1L-like [Ostrea edulis]